MTNEEKQTNTLEQILESPLENNISLEVVVTRKEKQMVSKYELNFEGTKILEGTIEKIIIYLTDPKYSNYKTIKQFLLIYRNFLDPDELMKKLSERFETCSPNFQVESEFTKLKLTQIHSNVINFLNIWINEKIQDFVLNEVLVDATKHFLEKQLSQVNKYDSIRLLTTLNIQMGNPPQSIYIKGSHSSRNNKNEQSNIIFVSNYPESIKPSNLKKLKFEDLSPIEVARQLTLIDEEIFHKISSFEFVNLLWTKEPFESETFQKQSPNLNRFLFRFNSLRLFVISTILIKKKSVINRANTIDVWVEIANQLLILNNYNSVYSIVSALQSHAIMRLDLTWREVKIGSKRLIDQILTNISPENNYRKYRNILKNTNLPVIPFLDLYLYDIARIDHLYPNYIINGHENNNNDEKNNKKIINYKKFILISKILNQIETFQKGKYLLNAIPEMKDFLMNNNNDNERNLIEDELLIESKTVVEKNSNYNSFNLLFGYISENKLSLNENDSNNNSDNDNSDNNNDNNNNNNNNNNNQNNNQNRDKNSTDNKNITDNKNEKKYNQDWSCWSPKLRKSLKTSNLVLTDEIEEQENFIKEFQKLKFDDCLLEEDDDFENNSKTIIIAATVEWLVDYLCSELESDSEYIQIFLLTYRSFTTATELFNLLKKKYLEKPPNSLTGNRLEFYKQKITKQIKFRIFNVLNQWIRFHFYDFESDPSMIELIENFITDVLLPDKIMTKPAEMLKKILMKKLANQQNNNQDENQNHNNNSSQTQNQSKKEIEKDHQNQENGTGAGTETGTGGGGGEEKGEENNNENENDDENEKEKDQTQSGNNSNVDKENDDLIANELNQLEHIPKPLLSQNLIDISFNKIDFNDFTYQITLVEFDLYRKIQPKECLKQGWTKKDKLIRAPNIVNLTNYFNNISNWIATEIISHYKLKKRIKILTKFIKILIEAKKIGNYNVIQEIIAGLNNAAVYRLKKTWSGISTTLKSKFDDFVKLMDRNNNYGLIRKELSTRDPPVLPYIGMYLTDLVFVDEGNSDFLTSLDGRKKLINFDKRRRTSFVIREIQLYQQAPFIFQRIKPIQDFILKFSKISYNDEEMYKRSLEVEPRDKK
ncbi:guanine nucleotide exchange factor [Anaeramoeba flamelloides]|uniref:Guanine nucleotide exchange factor n=1 Tax=Anaeramoeba flamelloides TaxID=1746091 RepID=A0ABQ8Z4T8_9EUKA|nr:guanine nucleotide exchange factor [Anaeramoeba flamelloides]